MSGAHALLSASAAHRWLHCTRAPRLEETLPEKPSGYAEEGRLAHEIAELKLRNYFTAPNKRSYTAAMNKLKKRPGYQEEMQRYTDTYLDYVKGLALSYTSTPVVFIEKRLDYSAFAPEGFGTGDCVIIGGDLLQVVDFKYGKGVPVDATDNAQMMLYGLGALMEYAPFYDVRRVALHIVQPRLDSASSWEIAHDGLINWGTSEVKPKAQMAYSGEGEFIPGDWCQFCRAAGKCRAQKDTYLSLESYGGKLPPLLSDAETGEVLAKAQGLKKWVGKLESCALDALLEGREIPGWKAVAGRSNRVFDDTDAAFKAITAAGVDASLLYTREPLTLTEVESLLGKARFKELAGAHVCKPLGKPTLAPITDNREPYKRSDVKNDFAEILEAHKDDNSKTL